MYPLAFDLTEVFRCAPRLSALHTATHCVAHRGVLEARPVVVLVFGMLLRAPSSPCVRVGGESKAE